MATQRQYAVLGPLAGGVETRAFLGCEVIEGAPAPDSPVVIVWLPDEVAKDPRQVSRLQRETAFVTQLRHPNINRIHGLECFEEGWARVLVYEDGEQLSRALAKLRENDRTLEPLHAARIMVDACSAVHFAHEEGLAKYAGRPIVHGGLRPDTLFLTFEGYTQVAGFGASTMPGPQAFAYLAPEQIIGGKATASPSTDTYALGAILYELLAGKSPFSAAPDIERAVLTGDPPSIDQPGLSGRLGNIATTAMAKRGSDRFESVGVMRDAIITALQGEELPTHEVMARFFTGLFPASSTERASRRSLLESAKDPDSVSMLSRPTKTPSGVDAQLFEAARPAPVSTTSAAIIDPAEFGENAAREEKTMVDVKVPFAARTLGPVPRQPADEAPTEAGDRDASTEVARADEPEASAGPSASWESMIAQAAQAASRKATQASPRDVDPEVSEATYDSRPDPRRPVHEAPPESILSAPTPASSPRTSPLDPPLHNAVTQQSVPVSPIAAVPQVAPAHLQQAPVYGRGAQLAPTPQQLSAMPPQQQHPHAQHPQAQHPHAMQVPPFGSPTPQPFAPPQPQQFGQPNAQQYGQPNAQQFGQPNGPQYGQPNGPQYGQPNGPQHGQPNAQQFGQPNAQQFGQPNAQPYGQPNAQQFGQPNAQPYGQPNAQQFGPQNPQPGQPSAQQNPQPHGQPHAQPYGQPNAQQFGPPSGPQQGQPHAQPFGQSQHGQPHAQPFGQHPGAQPPQSQPPHHAPYGQQPPASMLAQSGVQHSLPQGQHTQAPQALPSFAAPGHQQRPTQPPPQQARPNGPAAALKGPAAIPRAPMRDVSAITNFDRKVGDSSRSVLIVVLLAAAALLGGIFFWTEAPPEVQQGAQEETRHALPKDLVRQALEHAGENKEPDPQPTPEEVAAEANAAAAAADPNAKKDPAATDTPAVPQDGKLTLSTDPEVDVYAGNTLLGRTPLSAKLASGNQRIRFTDKKTGLNVYKTYKVRGGAEVRDHISFGTSELIIDAPDGASILLNSRFIGTAPIEPVKIYEGKYHLKVTMDGKSWADNFEAPPGRKINYKVTLNN